MSEDEKTLRTLKDRYERPNQKWVCGHACEGNACRVGPDARGRCRATFQCQPAQMTKEGATKGRYVCTRPAAYGGPCEQGPYPDGSCCLSITPCQPKRSVQALRQLTTLWLVLITIGGLAAVFGHPARNQWLSPGPITSSHQMATSWIANQNGPTMIDSCSACHVMAHQGPSAWIEAAFSSIFKDDASDDRLCLNCHNLGDHPLIAHNVPVDQLAVWTGQRDRNDKKSPFDPTQPVDCAMCHKEHHGTFADLTEMSDRQCQVCHAQPFSTFAENHPPFPTMEDGHTIPFPFKRRTKIVFDHLTHFQKHFHKNYDTNEHVPHQCTDCHSLNPYLGSMDLKPFEQTCATCHHHTQQIEGTLETEPFLFIQLPGIDTKSARKGGVDISFWKAGRRHGNQELTPILQLLLSGATTYPSPDYPGTTMSSLADDVQLLSTLPKGFRDLRKASQDQLQAVERIAYAVRYLFVEISSYEGVEGFRSRIEQAIGRPLSHDELADLTSHLPLDAIRLASQEWFEPISPTSDSADE